MISAISMTCRRRTERGKEGGVNDRPPLPLAGFPLIAGRAGSTDAAERNSAAAEAAAEPDGRPEPDRPA